MIFEIHLDVHKVAITQFECTSELSWAIMQFYWAIHTLNLEAPTWQNVFIRIPQFPFNLWIQVWVDP